MAEEARMEEETHEKSVLSPILESMEVEAPADSSHGEDSESDSDSDSDSEANDKLQVQTLESELYSNPSNYDAHVQYIKLLRRMGDIQKIRTAREAMSSLFPLTPATWQEWAQDEAFLNSGPDTFPSIEKLYERGISEYLYVPLWCDYINFVQEHDPSICECSPAGISKARTLFERAVTAAGLHVAEGNKIWEAYREFEQAILLTIDESDTEAREKQLQRIRSLFHRQLSIPLVDSESSLLAYKTWEVEQGKAFDIESNDLDKTFPHVSSAHKKAFDMFNARAQFEEQISQQNLSDAERLQHYLVYLKFEQSMQDPSRVNILYERAVTDFPVSADLWLDYTSYLNKTLKVGNVVKDVHLRATRNCTWVGELWVRYLLCLERCRSSETDISAVFEKSLQCTFSSLDEYLDLYLTRIDGLRRRVSSAGETKDPLDHLSIRDIFQRASDYLSPHLKNTQTLLHLYAYWARLEATLGKDLVACRRAWESLLKTCGSMLEAWQGYIAMEIEFGNISEARSIYKRCYTKRFPGMGSEEICYCWLRFEREFGKLEDFDYAVQKVTPRLEELKLFASQQEARIIDPNESNVKKNREKKRSSTDATHDESPAKRKKEAILPIRSHGKKKSQPENAIESVETQDVNAKAEESDKIHEQGKKDAHLDKSKVFTDQLTAFVSNIDLKATNNHLSEFFSDTGGVKAIRILHDKFTGKSRGLAYIDFVDEEHLSAAIAKNKRMLLGKKLSIARSNPKKNRKDSSGHGSGEQNSEAGKSFTGDAVDNRGEQSGVSHTSRPAAGKRGSENVVLKGKNTFAMPRSVRPLGFTASKPEATAGEEEKPKSNDEFRQMLLKK
ncbi:hypothetical protein SAY86_025325 [Trapa natans]|uniref:RRM domain-containing protein n=1 Tax=Trapa natans TaxID=22666 RepID=A0AAN7MQT9_TRANT|nr:hypothetical protein SAY86_025325 [Trapa natans]